ncbi:MAG: hypothetical protein ACOX6J_03465 [Oscillospiraceae bacterium]
MADDRKISEFDFPVRMNREEVSLYRTWGTMIQRYAVSLLMMAAAVFVVFTVFKYLAAGGLIKIDAFSEFLASIGMGSGAPVWIFILYDLALLILLLIVSLLLITAQKAAGRSAVAQRHIICWIKPEECVVECSLQKGREVLEKQTVGLYDAISCCDPFSQIFTVNGITYRIGTESFEDIYPGTKHRAFLPDPPDFHGPGSDLKVYCSSIRSVIDSIGSSTGS